MLVCFEENCRRVVEACTCLKIFVLVQKLDSYTLHDMTRLFWCIP